MTHENFREEDYFTILDKCPFYHVLCPPPTHDLLQLVTEVEQWDTAALFHHPIPKDQPWSNAYFRCIARPMDLTTLRKKILSGPVNVQEELLLMVRNALTFNRPEDPNGVWKYAKQLEKWLHKKFRPSHGIASTIHGAWGGPRGGSPAG